MLLVIGGWLFIVVRCDSSIYGLENNLFVLELGDAKRNKKEGIKAENEVQMDGCK